MTKQTLIRTIMAVTALCLAAMTNTSCTKAFPGDEDSRQEIIAGAEASVCINFHVSDPNHVATKAIDDPSGDNNIAWMDVLIYDHLTWECVGRAHIDENSITEGFKYKSKAGASYDFLFLANLHPDVVDYYAEMTLDDLHGTYCICPMEGTYGRNRLFMAGSVNVLMNGHKAVNVNMYKYFWRLDLKNIAIDFDDPQMYNRDIRIKRIAITNAHNILEPFKFPTRINNPEMFFGRIKTFTFELFGGGNAGYPAGYDAFDVETPTRPSHHTPDESSILYSNFKKMWNFNRSNTTKGYMKIDVPAGDMYDALVMDFAEGEGVISTAASPASAHTVAIDRSFYGQCGTVYSVNSTMFGNISAQDATTKLVIEIEMDGSSYFYPIRMIHPQPNTVYTVNTITLKGAPSEYCNKYEANYYATMGNANVIEWGQGEVDNIDVGYNPQHNGIY